MGEPIMIHDFNERLQFSLEASCEPFWEAVYNKAFPTMTDLKTIDDLSKQRLGIDRVVFLENGKEIYIDEKKREKVYSDILLEYISVDTTGAPGWMEKDLAIDYIAYAFMPTQRVYLFPWDFLKRAWDHYKEKWLADYEHIPGYNSNYTTWSVAVPISILQKAVTTATVIQLSADDN
jgi:hypothetical protein